MTFIISARAFRYVPLRITIAALSNNYNIVFVDARKIKQSFICFLVLSNWSNEILRYIFKRDWACLKALLNFNGLYLPLYMQGYDMHLVSNFFETPFFNFLIFFG